MPASSSLFSSKTLCTDSATSQMRTGFPMPIHFRVVTLCAILFINFFATAAAAEGGSIGSILREYWTGIGNGNNVSSIPTITDPSGTEVLTSLEGPSGWGNEYGARIRGYLVPPTTGSYVFYIAGDNECELWLSTSADPGDKVRIARVYNYTGHRDWDAQSSQVSGSISLTANANYYIEVLHKEGVGGDHVSVGWRKPGESGTVPSEIIPGSSLRPFLLDPAAEHIKPLILYQGIDDNCASLVSPACVEWRNPPGLTVTGVTVSNSPVSPVELGGSIYYIDVPLDDGAPTPVEYTTSSGAVNLGISWKPLTVDGKSDTADSYSIRVHDSLLCVTSSTKLTVAGYGPGNELTTVPNVPMPITFNSPGFYTVTAGDTAPTGSISVTVHAVPPPQESNAEIVNGVLYKIVALHSGKNLAVHNSSVERRANLIQRTDDGSTSAHWVAEDVGSGHWRFSARNSNSVCDVLGASSSNGAHVIQWPWHGGNNQKWTVSPAGDPGSHAFKIISVNSAKALTVTGASTSSGAQVEQATYTGADNQLWQFVRLGGNAARNYFLETNVAPINVPIPVSPLAAANNISIESYDSIVLKRTSGVNVDVSATQPGSKIVTARIGSHGPVLQVLSIKTAKVNRSRLYSPDFTTAPNFNTTTGAYTGIVTFEMRPYLAGLVLSGQMFAHTSTFLGGAKSFSVPTDPGSFSNLGESGFVVSADPVTGESIGTFKFAIVLPAGEYSYCLKYTLSEE